MAGLGSIGFALIFQLRGTKLITIGLGGALAWFIFLIGRMRGNAMIGLFLGLIRKYVMPYAVDPALMGNIMLLIPGIPFTNSIRDMLSGDTMSGLLRMCECLLRTVAVAAGFVGVMTLLGVAGI